MRLARGGSQAQRYQMNAFWAVGLSAVTVLVITMVTIRLSLKRRSRRFCERISAMPSYAVRRGNPAQSSSPGADREQVFIGITSDLKSSFEQHIVGSWEEETFTSHYAEVFQEACALSKKLETFHLKIPEAITGIIRDFKLIHDWVKEHNESIIKDRLKIHKSFWVNTKVSGS